MELFEKKEHCCGCTACKHACPKNAIAMSPDVEGFLYPEIDETLCVECGICKKVCPLQNPFPPETGFAQQVFAARHKNPDVVRNSSSGGAFTAVSDCVLSHGGVVYGAGFDEAFRVCHQRAETPEERDRFRGSKYVQSDLGDLFLKVQADLQQEKKVLFSGTPCQNAGLLSFLKQAKTDTGGLYRCDFVCHGVPSPLIWKEYVRFLQNQSKDKLVAFSFRDKSRGWAPARSKAVFQNSYDAVNCNRHYSFLSLYKSLFPVRSSCFRCRYTSYRRVSDLTVADFWNIRNSKPELDDNTGTSLILVNSQKGEFLLRASKENLTVAESTAKACWQPHLQYPCAEPAGRDRFWKEYREKGAEFVIRKYGKGSLSSRVKTALTPLIRALGLYRLAGKIYGQLFSGKSASGR